MKNKRIMSLILAGIVLCCSIMTEFYELLGDKGSVVAEAIDLDDWAEKHGDWWYIVKSDNTAQICGYSGHDKTIRIPSKLGNITVTSLSTNNIHFNTGFMESTNTYYDFEDNTVDESKLCTVVIPASIEYIDYYFFWSVKDVDVIEVDEKNKYFTSYDGMLFTKDMKTLLDCPEGKQGNIIIPNGTVNIGSKQLIHGEMVDYFEDLTDNHFINDRNLAPFEDCNGITEINLPESVERINERNTVYCINLEKINIPSKARVEHESLGYYCVNPEEQDWNKHVYLHYFGFFVFLRNNKLNSVEVSNSNPYYIVKDNIVLTKGALEEGNEGLIREKILLSVLPWAKNVKIPSNTIELFDNNVFSCCEMLEKIYIGSGISDIQFIWSFSQCKKLIEINVDAVNKNYSSVDGVVYNKEKTELLYCPVGKKELVVAEKTSVIKNMACYEGLLSTLVLPEGVKTIESSAFTECMNLKSVTIPKSVTEIGDNAFGYYTTSVFSPFYKINGFKIYCYKDSAGEKYAKENGFEYSYIYLPTSRLAGAGRYETAVEISKAGFPDGSDTVVLAYGLNYADALAGVSLAKAKNAPILLTNLKTLPAETLAEIKRLKAKNVIILGGTGAISDQVKKELENNGLTTERIAGASRFGTATAIAEKLNENPTDVFFVYAFNSADALSVSPIAASKNAPIIYLTTKGELNADTATYLAKLKKAGSVKNAYVIGGEGVISNDMATKAAKALGLSKATRIAGKDRYETCVAVNEKFADLLDGDMLCVATGMDFPDALAGGVYAAKNKAPLFLVNGKLKTPKLSDEQKAYLKTKAAAKITTFGGVGVVPDSHIEDIAKNSI